MAASRYQQGLPRSGRGAAAIPLEQAPEGVTRRALLHLLETFFRRPILFLLPLILLSALGVMTAMSADEKFRSIGVLNASSGSLLSEITENEGGFGYERPSVVTARSINQLLGTGLFLNGIIEESGMNEAVEGGLLSHDEVRSSISAEASGDTLVAISASTAVPEWSQRLAAATLNGFRDYVVDNDVADATVRIETYDGLVEESQQRFDGANTALEEYVVAHPEPLTGERPVTEALAISRLTSDVTRAEDALLESQSSLTDAELAREVSATVVGRQLRVLDEPALPTSATSGVREKALTVGMFVVLGLALSIASVVLATVLDRSIRVPSDLSGRFGLEVLGVVPSARRA